MAGLKHKLKLGLRGALARAFAYTPLGSLANRLAPPRLLILFGHCVDDTRYGGVLAPDMCLSERRFGEVLDALAKRGVTFDSIGGGWERLRGSAPPRATVAVSMDDGYRDNAETMGPILAARGIPATVFLETRALDERRVNWTHHLHWLFDELGGEATSLALAERARGPSSRPSSTRPWRSAVTPTTTSSGGSSTTWIHTCATSCYAACSPTTVGTRRPCASSCT